MRLEETRNSSQKSQYQHGTIDLIRFVRLVTAKGKIQIVNQRAQTREEKQLRIALTANHFYKETGRINPASVGKQTTTERAEYVSFMGYRSFLPEFHQDAPTGSDKYIATQSPSGLFSEELE
jgi:hypothetical protein